MLQMKFYYVAYTCSWPCDRKKL